MMDQTGLYLSAMSPSDNQLRLGLTVFIVFVIMGSFVGFIESQRAQKRSHSMEARSFSEKLEEKKVKIDDEEENDEERLTNLGLSQ